MASRGVKPASTRSLTASCDANPGRLNPQLGSDPSTEAPTSLDEPQREWPLTSRRRGGNTWLADKSPHVEIGLTRGGMQHLQFTLAERAHPVDRRRRQRDLCLDELEKQRVRSRVSRVARSAWSEVAEARKPRMLDVVDAGIRRFGATH